VSIDLPQSRGEHAGPEAYAVADPFWRIPVWMQSWHMRTNPSASVRQRIEAAGNSNIEIPHSIIPPEVNSRQS
jgi:hypothetical protein